MITGYKDGADLLLLNTMYIHPEAKNDFKDDCLIITYRDNNTMEIKHEEIINPEYTYYIDKSPNNYNPLLKEKKSFEPVTCLYREVLKDIAEKTDNLNFFYDNIRAKNRTANRELYLQPSIFGADIPIEDYYRYLFYQKYTPSKTNVTKSYFDIETDIISIDGGRFVELGECPISLMTLLDDKTETVYVFIYNDKGNPLIEQFRNKYENNRNAFFSRLMDSLITSLNNDDGYGVKRVKKYKLDTLEYKISFYDEEIDMINAFFDLVDDLKPTFMLAWNGLRFDYSYVYERIITLGYDPSEVMTSRHINNKKAYYVWDTKNDDNVADRTDFFFNTSYTTYIDQMLLFMSRRKGGDALPKNNLDYVGEVVAKAKKLSYKHITNNIKQFPYKDFELYVIYNIIDTIVQRCIEIMSMDVDYVFNKAMMNNTRYHKVGNNTVYLKNRFIKMENDNGNIVNNNCNIFNSKSTYPGAYVANPINFIKSGLKINGTHTDVYLNNVDYDFTSLHPSIQLQHNLTSMGLIGKAYIDENIYENEFGETDIDQAGMFFNDLCNNNYISTCNRWFNLPNIEEMIDIINKSNPLLVYDNQYVKLIDDDYINTPIEVLEEIESPIYLYRKDEDNKCITVI